MERFWISCAALAALAACSSSNPFTGTETDAEESGIPEIIASDLDGIVYDAANQTLTVRGVTLDGSVLDSSYTRNAALDRGGYEAYTFQESSLDRHSTAYVKEINGTRAAIVVTGGQFETYFGGGIYGRTGAFDPPEVSVNNGLVNYAGSYVGLTNITGDGGDLLPVAPGTDDSVRPVQAAEVTGDVLINADFVDNSVNGIIYNRVIQDASSLVMLDLAMQPGTIAEDGTFTGDLTINNQNRGTYAGIFGGEDASAVAGAIFAEDHIDGIDNEEEYGAFVLQACGTPGEDPLCNQPTP